MYAEAAVNTDVRLTGAGRNAPVRHLSSWCLCVFVVGLLFPLAASAAEAAKNVPAVSKIVNEAIKAVQKTSYRAQLKFLSQVDGNSVREVKLYHLSPDLYRVEPLDTPYAGEYMVENASELVRVNPFGQVIQLPRRQFAINDALTIKFLRDLGAMNPKTTVLSGRVGKYDAWMLRQDMNINKPYIITVGIDKKTWYPLFLMVIDGQGRARVYYEIEEIDYRRSSQLPDSLFETPNSDAPARLPYPPEGGRGILSQMQSQPLPLFPSWLPADYRVEGLSLLRCPRGVPGRDCALVYQLEAYGPNLDDMISIFQMQAGAEAKKALSKLSETKGGYVVAEKDGWVIAVFGDLPHAKLKKIATSLANKPDRVQPLLQQTSVRDVIMDELRQQQ